MTEEQKKVCDRIVLEVLKSGKIFGVIHYVGADADVTGAEITRQHKVVRGWSRDGYHYFLNADGYLEKLEDLSVATSGMWGGWSSENKYYVDNSFQICFETLDHLLMNELQNEILFYIMSKICERRPEFQVAGHREMPDLSVSRRARQATLCPGYSVEDWYIAKGGDRKNCFYSNYL